MQGTSSLAESTGAIQVTAVARRVLPEALRRFTARSIWSRGGRAWQGPRKKPLAVCIFKSGVAAGEKLPGILLQPLLVPGIACGYHLPVGLLHHHLQS